MGLPCTPGVSEIDGEDALNFALFSDHATRVTLLLFKSDDVSRPALTLPLDCPRRESNRMWHRRVPKKQLETVAYYAYRVEGPDASASNSPLGRHRFDSKKVLFDPYARGLYFPPGFQRAAALGPGSTMGKTPLGVLGVGEPSFDPALDRTRRDESDLVIYELHVRGFTFNPNSGVGDDKRGTYVGLADKIPYLRELGVTAVELMPVFQFDPQEANYWGYMPVSFFVPHNRYARSDLPDEQIDEFREMVRAFHEADIEVLLDVVYNHTGEGGHDGPTYNLRGIDNGSYYLCSDDPESPYLDFSGTGNSLNCANRATRQLIVDSMRYWVKEMHVDGFRFDLGSLLARGSDGSVDSEPAIFSQIAADPDFSNIRLIAEPWDVAGLYQLGEAFPGRTWMQWNDKFRDDIRRFVRGDHGTVGGLVARLCGSSDVFPDTPASGYHPYQSINYIACHDGFTLYDIVSYNQKHNEANGLNGTDGHHDDYGWNCGAEGDGDATADILSLRKRQAKNLCCLLFLANGTPMFRAGDEFLQTQGGNNNPYNQDNETSWIDWSRLEQNADFFRFFKRMIAFRKAHASIRRADFWRRDVQWFGVGAEVDLSDDSHALAYFLGGASVADDDLYVLINGHNKDLEFEVQEGAADDWRRVVDTSRESPDDFRTPDEEVPLDSRQVRVEARSIVVLIRGGDERARGRKS